MPKLSLNDTTLCGIPNLLAWALAISTPSSRYPAIPSSIVTAHNSIICLSTYELRISRVTTLSFPPDKATKTLSPFSRKFSFLIVCLTFFSMLSIKQSLHKACPEAGLFIITFGFPHLVQDSILKSSFFKIDKFYSYYDLNKYNSF